MRTINRLESGWANNHITVVGFSHRTSKNAFWECTCSCGKNIKLTSVEFRRRYSCGCRKAEALALRATTHGLSKTKEYSIWKSMKRRCKPGNSTYSFAYRWYGAKGIRVCQRWIDSFPHFMEDMGPIPESSNSIDRIDNNGNYEPGNCRWASSEDQANNTSRNIFIEFSGESKTVAQWSREIGVKAPLVYGRLRANWPGIEALTAPARK